MVLSVFVSGVYYLCIFVFDLDNIYAHNIKYLVFFLSSPIVNYLNTVLILILFISFFLS